MAKKEYTIEAIGRYFSKGSAIVSARKYTTEVAEEQATKAIADMLRYDNGRVLYLNPVQENCSFTAIVRCSSYTKGRWDSFGIRTREVNYESYLNVGIDPTSLGVKE